MLRAFDKESVENSENLPILIEVVKVMLISAVNFFPLSTVFIVVIFFSIFSQLKYSYS